MVVVKNLIEDILQDECLASLYMLYKTEIDKSLHLYGIDAPTGSGRFHKIQYENPLVVKNLTEDILQDECLASLYMLYKTEIDKSMPLDLYGIDAPYGSFQEMEYEIQHKSMPLDLYGIDAPTGSFQEMEYEIPHILLPPKAPGIDEQIGSFQEMKYENSRLTGKDYTQCFTRLMIF